MKYDFTSYIDRHGKDAIAVEAIGTPDLPAHPKDGFDVIPMWVADMNFATVPSVQRAMIERINHPCFGYFSPKKEFYDGIINWHMKRHGVHGLGEENIGYENGVLGGVINAVNAVTAKGDNILLHSPTYIGFTACLNNNGYHLIHSPLVQDENNIWRMDFQDMEKKIVDHQIHTLVFCSPHNPCGRVWERWEIEKTVELCKKYDVYIISDEIWSDLILNGYKHIPTQAVNEEAKRRTVSIYAITKTFNLAGLIGSYHIAYDPWLRDRIRKECRPYHYNEMNLLSMYASIGAYSPEGEEWLEELRQVLTQNIEYVCANTDEHFRGVSYGRPQATYMLFLDCAEYCAAAGITIDDLIKRCYDVGVIIQDGRQFNGNCHIRLNLASPLSRIQEAMERLSQYVFI